jgi:glyoxylase-like metal-dependent hydrolase (beta-lactamase superfamily II)
MLAVKSFQFNSFQENTYIVYSEKKHAVIIDPGCYLSQEEKELEDFIQNQQLIPLAILNTHAHLDHLLGNYFCANRFDIPIYLHKDDEKTLKMTESYAHVYGFEAYKVSPAATHELKNGETLKFEDIELKVFHTPGHCPGHVVLYNESAKFVINGDVLFQGSFGRVDLPGGDLETLKKSIFETMFSFPDDTTVYCGHGPETSIGREKQFNYIHQF